MEQYGINLDAGIPAGAESMLSAGGILMLSAFIVLIIVVIKRWNGRFINVVAGIFDETMLKLRGCDATEISREPFCVAVSIHHRLAKKEKITLDDLNGENLMLMKRGWSYYGDKLRDFIAVKNPDINIVDFDLYNIEAFNRCENNNEVLLAFKSWESVHPLIRIIPVEWDYTMPFGILHSKEPSEKVRRLIKAINKIKA